MDAIRRRGGNISSFEVELVLRRGSDVTADALVAHYAQSLPRFAVPRYREFRPDLPKNQVGRVLKHPRRAEPLADTTWDCDA